MIKNLILDFGAVLLPLDTTKTDQAFKDLGALESLSKQNETFELFETGKVSGEQFLRDLQPHFFRKKIYPGDLKKCWNAMLGDLPEDLIPLLKKLKKNYRLFLLSNTNQFHIDHIRQSAGPFLYKQFISQFDQVYYSHEVGLRKPDPAIFENILKEHQLEPSETLYVDDTRQHVKAAKALGIKGWHFKPEEHEIEDLTEKIASLNNKA